MSEILIFGGTTEGRELAEFCSENRIIACVSVTTDYGAELLPEDVKVIVGRLDLSQIKKFISEKDLKFIIDATHPYAAEATQNIAAACKEINMPCYRVIREQTNETEGSFFESVNDIIEYLNRSEKQILSVLGSKEIAALTGVNNYRERIWIRVIPDKKIAEQCEKYGFDKNKIIFGQGPFSPEENIEHIKKSGAEILVTKESGAAGGYPQKVRAAKTCGIELITLKRPAESGVYLNEMKKIILNGVK